MPSENRHLMHSFHKITFHIYSCFHITIFIWQGFSPKTTLPLPRFCFANFTARSFISIKPSRIWILLSCYLWQWMHIIWFSCFYIYAIIWCRIIPVRRYLYKGDSATNKKVCKPQITKNHKISPSYFSYGDISLLVTVISASKK